MKAYVEYFSRFNLRSLAVPECRSYGTPFSMFARQGKPIVAHLISGEPLDYSVAAACDRIVMPPAATLAITGVRTEVTFYKGLLDRLGIQAEILQVGEFKGAGEPLTRDSMSPQLRKQYEVFVGDLFEQMVEQISEDRDLKKKKSSRIN